MARFLRTYRGPLIAGGGLFVASCVWAWLYLDTVRDREAHQKMRTAASLAVSLSMLLDPEVRAAAGGEDALGRLIEARLEIRRPLVFAIVVSRGRRLASLGDVPEGLPTPLEPGFTEDGAVRIVRVPIGPGRPPRGLGPPRPQGPPRPPGSQRPDDGPPLVDWRWRTGGGGPPASLVAGIETSLSPHVLAETLPSLGLVLTVCWAGILALVLAWMRSIRSRDLARALDVERRERARLEEMNLAAAGLAHETKNPLGIILGLAQRIERTSGGTPEIREAASHIIDAADRAAARVSDFLGFARIPAPKLEPVRADLLLGRVVAALAPDFEEAGVRVTVEAPEISVECSAGMMEQVLVNLLLNSLQASEAGTTVTLRLAARGATAVLVVEDQGRGIPPELVADLFKPYVTGNPDGHGLGLAIVRRIVEQHGWTVDIETAVGKGTRVVIAGITVARQKERA